MLDKRKTDPELGQKISKYLQDVGVEIPMCLDRHSAKDKIATIEEAFAVIMEYLSLDLTDDSLADTPIRVAKMYVNELFWGLDYNNFPKIKVVENKMHYSSMVLERDIKVVSCCVPGWQPLNTSTGCKRAREVKVGDKLWTLCNGAPVHTTVEHISTHTSASTVKVTLSNGVSFTVTPDHPLKLKEGWVEAKDSLGKKVEYCNPHTFCKEPFDFNICKELGYFLAVVAAECSIQDDRRICLETENEEVADNFIEATKKVFGKTLSKESIMKVGSFTGKEIRQFRVRIVSSQIAKRTLRMLGIPLGVLGCRSKTFKSHLPEICKHYHSVWRGFLDGYIATDGTHYVGRDTEYKRIFSSNEAFVNELCDFLKKKTPKSKVRNVQTRPCYSVNITPKEHSHEWFRKHGFPKEDFSLDLGESDFVEVVSIEETMKPTKVYSFKCKEHPTFCIRGVLTHNCEHHFLPFIGKCYIAYIPENHVIGLSKLNRIVEFFSRRPQVQERLTEQIYHALCCILETENVAVLIKAEHSCVKLRGVEDNSNMVTSRLGGNFFAGELRNEFLSLINSK